MSSLAPLLWFCFGFALVRCSFTRNYCMGLSAAPPIWTGGTACDVSLIDPWCNSTFFVAKIKVRFFKSICASYRLMCTIPSATGRCSVLTRSLKIWDFKVLRGGISVFQSLNEATSIFSPFRSYVLCLASLCGHGDCFHFHVVQAGTCKRKV